MNLLDRWRPITPLSYGSLSRNTLHSLYLFSIALAVIPFGSTGPLPLSIATLFACFTSMAALAVYGVNPCTKWLFVTILLLGVVTSLWVEIQTLPGSEASIQQPMWALVRLASAASAGLISIEPADSIETLMFLALPMMTFLTGLTVIRSDADARRLLAMLSLGGTGLAIYGLAQFALFPTINLFYPKYFYTDSVTTTFINHNTAGTFLGMVCLLLLRQAWSSSSRISIPSISQKIFLNRSIRTPGVAPFLAISAFAGCDIVALLLTKSRGAIASSVVAILLLVCLLSFLSPSKQNPGIHSPPLNWKGLRLAGLASACVLLTLLIFGGQAIMRLEVQGAEDGRYCVLPGIVELAKSEPVVGHGLGTFRYAFPSYRDPHCGVDWVWDRAHNFYLEGFIALGMLFAVILIVGAAALIASQAHGLMHRRAMRSYPALGLSCLLLVGLHGLVDFSLQIPGLAAFLAAILAATSAVSLGKPHVHGPADKLPVIQPDSAQSRLG